MKTLRRIFCLLLAGSLLFAAACGKKEKEKDTDFGAGRYTETDITPPIDGRFMSYLSADGTIICFDDGLKTRYESTDGGGSWNNSPGPGSSTDRYQSTQGGALLSDGSLLVFIQNEGLEIVAPDGSSKPFPVDEIDKAIAGEENVYVSLLQAFGNRVLLSYMIGGFVQTVRGNGPQGGNASTGGNRQIGGPSTGSGTVTQGRPQGDTPDDAQGNPQNRPQGDMPDGAQGNPQGEPQGDTPDDAQSNPQGRQQGVPQVKQQAGSQGDPQNTPQDGSGDGAQTYSVYEASSEGDGEQSGDAPATSGGQSDSPGGGPAGGPSRGTSGGAAAQMRSKTFLCDLSTGQIITELSVENASSAVSDDSFLYLLDATGGVSIYNLADGSPSGKPEIRFTSASEAGGMMRGFAMRMGGGSTLALGNDGNLYAALDSSLLIADPNGNVSTALESTAYSIGAPRSSVNSVFTLADGSIVVNMLDNGQTNRLYKYSWNENAAVNSEKALTVWSLEDNNFVRAAISELRKAHPDSLITYEVALGGNSAVSASDAIRTLNTQLLSGNGPDVILLDGCSVDSYSNTGMLLDLSGLINTDDIFDSLLTSYTNNGKLYCLPTQFLMPMLMGSAEALNEVQSLDDLIDAAVNGNDLPASGGGGPRPFSGVDESERAALYFSDLKELRNILWISCAPDVVKNNQLNTDALRRYLQAVKAISDKYSLAEETTGRGGMGMSVAFSDGGVATALPGSLMWYTMQLTHYAAFSAGNLQLLQMMMDRAGSTLELFPGITSGAWQPSTVVGISADAKNQEFAAELVQAMLSVSVQQLNYGTGLPVTRAGLDAQVTAINERRIENGEEPFSFNPNALVDQLQSPSMGDTVLTDMMWSSVEKCCKGEIDVEGAVKEIEQNVKNYLAERE